MKSLSLRKMVAVAVAVATIATVSPVGVSAAWKQEGKYNWSWTEKGKKVTGWKKVSTNWYHFNAAGTMQRGWLKDGAVWYYLQSTGAMKTGWAKVGGTWYYLQSTGVMKTGWIKDRGTWYFADSTGAMQTGVIQVNGKVYSFAATGAMQVGDVTINGKVFTFAATTGEAVGVIPTPVKAFNSLGVPVPMNLTAGTPIVDTIVDTSSDDSDSSSSHSSGGSSSSDNDGGFSQSAVNKYFANNLNIKFDAKQGTLSSGLVATRENGVFKFAPKLNFVPSSTNQEKVTIKGEKCTVIKDIYVTLDGKDANLAGNVTDGYEVSEAGKVNVSVSIAVLSSKGKLYYVVPKTYTISVK